MYIIPRAFLKVERVANRWISSAQACIGHKTSPKKDLKSRLHLTFSLRLVKNLNCISFAYKSKFLDIFCFSDLHIFCNAKRRKVIRLVCLSGGSQWNYSSIWIRQKRQNPLMKKLLNQIRIRWFLSPKRPQVFWGKPLVNCKLSVCLPNRLVLTFPSEIFQGRKYIFVAFAYSFHSAAQLCLLPTRYL